MHYIVSCVGVDSGARVGAERGSRRRRQKLYIYPGSRRRRQMFVLFTLARVGADRCCTFYPCSRRRRQKLYFLSLLASAPTEGFVTALTEAVLFILARVGADSGTRVGADRGARVGADAPCRPTADRSCPFYPEPLNLLEKSSE